MKKRINIARPKHFITTTFIALVVLVVSFSACGPNESILKSNRSATPPPASEPAYIERPIVTIEKEIEAMQTANFDFIFVLRRKDGAVMDTDDKGFIKAVTADANRRSLSGDGKAVIVGSNYRLPDETMKVLGERFDMEDHSKPASEIIRSGTPANANMKR